MKIPADILKTDEYYDSSLRLALAFLVITSALSILYIVLIKIGFTLFWVPLPQVGLFTKLFKTS